MRELFGWRRWMAWARRRSQSRVPQRSPQRPANPVSQPGHLRRRRRRLQGRVRRRQQSGAAAGPIPHAWRAAAPRTGIRRRPGGRRSGSGAASAQSSRPDPSFCSKSFAGIVLPPKVTDRGGAMDSQHSSRWRLPAQGQGARDRPSQQRNAGACSGEKEERRCEKSSCSCRCPSTGSAAVRRVAGPAALPCGTSPRHFLSVS